MAELTKGIELSSMAQSLAEIDKAMPDYQRLIDAMPVLKVNSHMEEVLKGFDIGMKSSALHGLMITSPLTETPGISDVLTRLTEPMSGEMARLISENSHLHEALESMNSQWRDIPTNALSFTSFAELQSIGSALEKIPAFNEDLIAALRIDLGDWRDSISWKPEIFTDIAVRSDFYEGFGFNRALTDFRPSVFEQSLDIAGLRRKRPALVALCGEPVPVADGTAEQELGRTNTAHDWLLRLETQIRAFIDREMKQAFGDEWPKHKLSNGVYDQWQEKKKKGEQAGGKIWPLIAYADFTDYMNIICRGDNWKTVFQRFFGRPESVRESLQRLYPIRISTMHARPISQDDELLLYAEIRRIVKAIGADQSN
jgi:hypothetical protein